MGVAQQQGLKKVLDQNLSRFAVQSPKEELNVKCIKTNDNKISIGLHDTLQNSNIGGINIIGQIGKLLVFRSIQMSSKQSERLHRAFNCL